MREHYSEVILVVSGLVATYSAWVMSGRQRAKNEQGDTLTRGADQIVETTNKLLEIAKKSFEEERSHRALCEEENKMLNRRVDELEEKLKEMEKIVCKQKK